MELLFEGKPISHWSELLQNGEDHERCAAALVLGEIDPNHPAARFALTNALNDPEKAVEVAAQIAIGFIYVPAENRRRMLALLLSSDESRQREVLGSLDELGYSNLMGTAGAPEQRPIERSASTGVATTVPVQASPSQAAPDIAVVNRFPWWFLIGGASLILGLAWFSRDIGWAKWVMIALAVCASLMFLLAYYRRQNGAITVERYHARVCPAACALVATLGGAGLGFALPEGTVYLDNECAADVRLLLDGNEWMTMRTGETRKRSLTRGKYRLTVQAVDGHHVLDEHDIEVTAYKRHVLNVLGAQFYFEGKVQYGGRGGHDMKLVRDKWFPVPDVDYLFRTMPEVFHSPNVVTKSYFTKGAPPKFQGDDRVK